MTLTPREAQPDANSWLVDGDVRLRRDGHPAGTWRWQFELRHHPAHGWRIWTVTDAEHQLGT